MRKSRKKNPVEKLKIRENVKKLVAEVAKMDYRKIKKSANIRDDLGVDSLMAMEILAAIEKRLGIAIDEAKAFNIVTVKNLMDIVMASHKKKR